MTTIGVLITLFMLALLGIGLLVVGQAREKARIEQVRKIKALEDAHSLLHRFIDELPGHYLDSELKRLILNRAREIAVQLQQLGALSDSASLIEDDEAALATLTHAEEAMGAADVSITDQEIAKEIYHLLQMLFRFIEKQQASGKIPTPKAREYLKHVRFLACRARADLFVFRANEHTRNNHLRQAIHGYHLAISELEKTREHPDAITAIKDYRERIKSLNKEAEALEHPELPPAGNEPAPVPEEVHREWDEFIQEEKSWKKKADYE